MACGRSRSITDRRPLARDDAPAPWTVGRRPRLRFWPWLLAWVLAGSPGLFAASLAGTPTSRPNLLLIISDDQAWSDYGFMGHPVVKTPRLDRLAAESLCFTRGYVPASLCCPSLASIVTGLQPHRHRVVCNDPPRPPGISGAAFYQSAAYREGRERLAGFLESVPTLPRALTAAGYRTFQAGKWWQGHHARGGFTHGMTRGDPDRGGRHGDEGLDIGRKTLAPVTDFVADATRDGVPWMVWYAPMMPHDPHTPPERILARYRSLTNSLPVARYWAMVEWFDESCGILLDDLKARGLDRNTVVAYVTDNGWFTDPVTGRYAPRSKQSPYDGGLRTPILLRWPGHIVPARVSTPVSSVDLMPTLLRLAGVPCPEGLDGVDLLDAGALRRRRFVTGACFTHDAVDLDRPASGLRWRWIVEGDWKLIVPAPWNEPGAEPELYRVGEDPWETDNRASREPARVRRLQRRLDSAWQPR